MGRPLQCLCEQDEHVVALAVDVSRMSRHLQCFVRAEDEQVVALAVDVSRMSRPLQCVCESRMSMPLHWPWM